jgi:hypothetical protein
MNEVEATKQRKWPLSLAASHLTTRSAIFSSQAAALDASPITINKRF